jgi:hypothetical protein
LKIKKQKRISPAALANLTIKLAQGVLGKLNSLRTSQDVASE